MNRFVDASEEAFQTIGPVIRQNLLLVQQIASAGGELFDRLQGTDLSALPTADELDRIAVRLAVAVKLVDGMADLLGKMDNLLPNHPLADKITRLNTLSDKLQLQMKLAGIISDALRPNTTPPADIVAQLNTLSEEINSGVNQILGAYDAEIEPALTTGADKLRSILSASADTLQDAQDNYRM